MSYYDDDKYFSNYYNNYYEEDLVEPVYVLGEEFSEKTLTDIILSAGLTSEPIPKYSGTMEKLVFMYGEDSEVYSSAEIRFIDQIDNVLVYPDFTKSLNQGNMICRAIATKFNCTGYDALKACISFEKIIDKALDGFNIFFFITEDNVFFGCRLFDKSGKRDCALSNPIAGEYEFEQLLDELSFLVGLDSFMEYYSQFQMTIMDGQNKNEDYEHMIIRRRGIKGIQVSYLDDLSRIERVFGVNMSKEKERYWHTLNDEPEDSFVTLLEEVEESLSFIKSHRVNTYEMLFEADEIMRQAEEKEAENDKLAAQADMYDSNRTDYVLDEEAKSLLDDPEEIVKLLKKRRGI